MARKSSRFYKTLEKKSRRNLVISVIGIIIILGVLFKFGIPLFADISFSFGQLFSGKEDQTTVGKIEDNFLPSPVLDQTPLATNSAKIKISGSATPEKKVELFLNGKSYDRDEADEDGEFTFNITLTEGENLIKARASDDKAESDFSETHIITFKKSEPKIELEKPRDGDNFAVKNIEVRGKTDIGNRVTINGFWAVVEGEVFSYNLELHDGENEIIIQAEDDAGNKKEQKLKVRYSP
ncbi:MAG: hypothetical protein HYT09_02580 [Candidatus Levybacteria bacterium]|nr:hypothetical protein [Candidatus Levybacteria bacterium]